MDTFSAALRSEVMRRVRSKDTGPEMSVRRLVHGMGFRYRVHRRDLPGNPDLVFPGLKKIIFVHGCFWHSHACSAGRNRPSSHRAYWLPKLERNRSRDLKNRRKLRGLGWEVMTIWECQLKRAEKIRQKIESFLERPHA